MQCVDDFVLREQTYVIDYDTWRRSALDLIRKHKYVKFWLDATTGSAVVYHADKATKTDVLNDNSSHFVRDVRVYLLSILQMLFGLVPGGLDLLMPIVMSSWPPTDRVVRYEETLVVPHILPRHYETEFALPVEQTVATIERWRTILSAHPYEMGHVMELRCVAADEHWLSPDYKQASVHITILSLPHRSEHWV